MGAEELGKCSEWGREGKLGEEKGDRMGNMQIKVHLWDNYCLTDFQLQKCVGIFCGFIRSRWSPLKGGWVTSAILVRQLIRLLFPSMTASLPLLQWLIYYIKQVTVHSCNPLWFYSLSLLLCEGGIGVTPMMSIFGELSSRMGDALKVLHVPIG